MRHNDKEDEDFTEYPEKVFCNLCGEEIDPADDEAVRYSGTLYGYSHKEVACGPCFTDPDFQESLSKVKNLKVEKLHDTDLFTQLGDMFRPKY